MHTSQLTLGRALRQQRLGGRQGDGQAHGFEATKRQQQGQVGDERVEAAEEDGRCERADDEPSSVRVICQPAGRSGHGHEGYGEQGPTQPYLPVMGVMRFEKQGPTRLVDANGETRARQQCTTPPRAIGSAGAGRDCPIGWSPCTPCRPERRRRRRSPGDRLRLRSRRPGRRPRSSPTSRSGYRREDRQPWPPTGRHRWRRRRGLVGPTRRFPRPSPTPRLRPRPLPRPAANVDRCRRRGDRGKESEASYGIGHQTTDEHRSPADLVGESSGRVLASQRGDEVGRHDDTDQGIGRATVTQVLRQEWEDRARPEPQEERRESEGSDEGLGGRVRARLRRNVEGGGTPGPGPSIKTMAVRGTRLRSVGSMGDPCGRGLVIAKGRDRETKGRSRLFGSWTSF